MKTEVANKCAQYTGPTISAVARNCRSPLKKVTTLKMSFLKPSDCIYKAQNHNTSGQFLERGQLLLVRPIYFRED